MWNVNGDDLQHVEAHRGGVTGIALLPDGTRARSSGADRTLKLLKTRNRDELRFQFGIPGVSDGGATAGRMRSSC
jgi:hypothetical protein